MEIHTPDGPTKSLRDFLIHIGIVTLGILIALGLEGIRESIREHGLLQDARRNFRSELAVDQDHVTREIQNIRETRQIIDKLIADFPALAQRPDQVHSRIDQIGPSFYFFSVTSWDTALSTGALGHMNTGEVSHYAGAYLSVRYYSGIEEKALTEWLALQAYFKSRTRFGPDEISKGLEYLYSMRKHEEIMAHVAGELADSLRIALK